LNPFRRLELRSKAGEIFEIERHDRLHNGFEKMERVKGIEPSYSAWKAAALPLSYTRDPFSMPSRAALCNAESARRAARIYPFDSAVAAH
jgi:hypothetical protein